MPEPKDTKDADPFALWRSMLSQWETNVNALANKTMASDEYSSSMHGTMGMTLRMQEAVRDFMAAYLATTNLPSRAEVLALGERIGALEGRLDRITGLLERIATAQTAPAAGAAGGGAAGAAATAAVARPRPPRTKTPPGGEPAA